MDARHTLCGGISRTLDQMLLDGFAGPFGIGVEGDQPFGLAAVVQSVVHDGADNGFGVGPGRKHGLQFGPESEFPDIIQQGVDTLAALAVVDELEQLFEHARRGARGGHELHDAQPPGGSLVTGHSLVGLRPVDHRHAVARRSGPHHVQKRESAAKIFQLGLDLSRSETVIGDLL